TTPLGRCEARPIPFNPPILGQWLTLQNNNSDSFSSPHLQLTKFQVFGVPYMPPPPGPPSPSPPRPLPPSPKPPSPPTPSSPMPNISNLALGRPAYSSSVYLHPGACSPAKAVDGVTAPYTSVDVNNPPFFASNDGDLKPWFSVDLGNLSYISSVVIQNRCDGFDDRMKNAELRIGNVSIQTSSNTSSIASNGLVWTQTTPLGRCEARPIPFNPPILGQWLTLQNNNSDSFSSPHLQLTEFQVFGVPYMPPPPGPPSPSPPRPLPPSPKPPSPPTPSSPLM
ncbi:hypothetical protein Vafri_12276, partial [Volvox africanus]